MDIEYEQAISKLKEFQKKERERVKNMRPDEILYDRIMDALEEFKDACSPNSKK
jgi:hypothetical protein